MGRYSYSQPSSSDGYDEIQRSLLEEEAALYAEERGRSDTIADPVQYPSQAEGVEEIPKTWWDVAVMEEVSEFQRQVRELKEQANDTEQKLVNLEKTVGELANKRSVVSVASPWVACAMVGVLVLICMVVMIKWEDDHQLKMRVSSL